MADMKYRAGHCSPVFQQQGNVTFGLGIVARPFFRPNGIINGPLYVDNKQGGICGYPHALDLRMGHESTAN
jgi:hypothetical protein